MRIVASLRAVHARSAMPGIAALCVLAAGPIAAAQPLPVQHRGSGPTVEVWQVDQVRLAPDTPPRKLAALEPDHSMEAVVKRLTAMGVPFTRTRAGLLPDRMPPALRDQISRLPPGEPFVIPGRDYISINVIVGRRLPPNTVRFAPYPRLSTRPYKA